MSEEEQGTATETTRTEETGSPQGAETRVATGSESGGGDLDKVRGLVLQAHPDVVPDLVRGASVDELIASVEPARAAYQSVAERVRAGGSAAGSGQAASSEASPASGAAGAASAASAPPVVPAGGAANVVDPASVPASEKIRRALEAQRKR